MWTTEHLKNTIFYYIDHLFFVHILPKRIYIKWKFKRRLGYSLNLAKPETFNEKLQWLKFNDIHEEYSQMVDKIDAKYYVGNIIGHDHIIKTLGVWNNVEDIDWDSLPNQFVIKVTSDSGGVVVCKDKSKLNIDSAKSKLKMGFGQNYYKYSKEYPYKSLKARILAEEYMEDSSSELRDYKFFCFNGKARFFKVDFNRSSSHQANYYDCDGNLLPFGETICPPDYNKSIAIPQNLKEMIEIANKLSTGIPFLRVDLYNVKGIIYFGELTFFPASGLGSFTDPVWDKKLGSYLQLPYK